ncbi:M24 family metallopeptidase [Mesobacillus jeotgali]|uniref:M24 family metallopeptidase n=1 Tax=Mesobacillus jeotgali TaxID=129985 RepID=UPI0009A8D2AD|nr:Xaa-Pro peptidase family protein [Mesobacillus jeotgali]
MNEKIVVLNEYLRNQDWMAGLITSKENIYYLSGFDYEPHERFVGIFLIGHKPLFVLPEMEMEMLLESGWDYDSLTYTDSENVWEKISRFYGDATGTIKELAVEVSCLSLKNVRHLKQMFPNTRIKNLDPKLTGMRMIKRPEEIKKLKTAATYADYAINIGIDALKEGVTELEVLAEIEYKLKKAGIRELSFSPMVLFGNNSSKPHGETGENQLKSGDTVIFDLGVKYEGYCSDITRTVIFKELKDEVKKMYETVLKANASALKECKPGNRIRNIDSAARHEISANGYGPYFPHRIGHGLGINIHEEPSLHSENENSLKTGMVLTVEPGIYIPGLGGIRIEDDVVITDNGCEVLTKFPKDLQVVKGTF